MSPYSRDVEFYQDAIHACNKNAIITVTYDCLLQGLSHGLAASVWFRMVRHHVSFASCAIARLVDTAKLLSHTN